MALTSDDRWTCPHCGLTVALLYLAPAQRQYAPVLRRMARDTHRCTQLAPIPERTTP